MPRMPGTTGSGGSPLARPRLAMCCVRQSWLRLFGLLIPAGPPLRTEGLGLSTRSPLPYGLLTLWAGPFSMPPRFGPVVRNSSSRMSRQLHFDSTTGLTSKGHKMPRQRTSCAYSVERLAGHTKSLPQVGFRLSPPAGYRVMPRTKKTIGTSGRSSVRPTLPT